MSALVISISTIPPRFGEIGATLQSLLAQTAKVDAVTVWIPKRYRRFGDWDGTLPEVPHGVEIRRCEEDLGPATKVLAAAEAYRGQDVDILFGDDDRDYPARWAERFLRNKAKRPGAAIANLGLQAHMIAPSTEPRKYQPRSERSWRMTDVEFQAKFLWRQLRALRWDVNEPRRRVFKRSGYVDIFEGCAGVLVRPDWFDDVAYDIPTELRHVDDVWLSGMLARADVPIWLHGNIPEPACTDAEPFAPLVTSVVEGLDRATANRLGVEYMQTTFGVWL